MKKFWNWKRKAVNLESGQEAEERILFMNGVIAEDSWFDDDVTPALFKDELNAGTGDITLWINSPGGDCVAAAQIFNMLSEYPGKVTVKIDGLAASAASVIAMAGAEVWMSPVSMMMIHNPATVAWGDHAEMKKAMELLDAVKESIINAYVRKTGQSRAKLSHLMDAETWMDANKAVELGFADDILFQKEEQGDDGDSVDDSTENGTDCVAKKPTGNRRWECVWEGENHWWGFPHLYYPSNPSFVEHFYQQAGLYQQSKLKQKDKTK